MEPASRSPKARLLCQALAASQRFGLFSIQAAIAGRACAGADTAADRLGPDRRAVQVLLQIEASPVVELNRAVAVAMRDGPAAGLSNLVDAIAG